jgi:hypothetical protein
MMVWEPMVTVVDEARLLFPVLPVVVQADFHPLREAAAWVHHYHKLLLVVRITMVLLLRLNHTSRGTTCRAAATTIVTCDMRHRDDMKAGDSIHLSHHRPLVLCSPCDLKTHREVVGDHHHRRETIV